MKHLIAILALSVSLFSANAQVKHFTIAYGMGYAAPTVGTIANLQVEYNISHLKIGYSQTMYLSDSKPAFFEGKIGYQIGNVYSFTPHAGYAYILKDISQGDGQAYLSYGSEFTLRLYQFAEANPRVFLDYNRVGSFNLCLIGFKASF